MKRELTEQQLIERSISKKYRSDIWSLFTKAVRDYELIQEGDTIAACICGDAAGALSAKLLDMLCRFGKVHFEVHFVLITAGLCEEQLCKTQQILQTLGITPNRINIPDFTDENLSIIAEKTKCNKIALGYNFDYVTQTTLENLLSLGKLQGVTPKRYTSDKSAQVIFPMYCIHDSSVRAWCRYNRLPYDSYVFNPCSEREQTELARSVIEKLQLKQKNISTNIFNSIHCAQIDTVAGFTANGVLHSFLENY